VAAIVLLRSDLYSSPATYNHAIRQQRPNCCRDGNHHEREYRAEYYCDSDMIDAVLSLVRAKAAVRRAELIAHIQRGGAPLQ
jgi:hypothetical protein